MTVAPPTRVRLYGEMRGVTPVVPAGGGIDRCPWWLVVGNVVVPMRVRVTSSRFTVTSLTKRGDISGALQR
ncbi:hypothetical protein DY000_02039449 [Brassica cretica]|uniref:Uncharacterized protein n=1 Tax=Brassica cretica TaxID=69181 RepID=A0ABQ7BF63_BRACR|nr:hypothetical protein DY000_02039449 [Brassica cretica]